MLIVAHDHYIVRKYALLGQVVMIVELIGHIVIDRQCKPAFMAGN